MKIVLNDCYGGFGLSYEAIALYLTTKSKTAYFYAEYMTHSDHKRIYKLIPLKETSVTHKNLCYVYCTTEYQGEELDHFPTNIFNDRDIDRTDRDLISVVEFLGPKAASGRYANLKIVDIPDGTMYRINTYDGSEEIEYRDNLGWETATSKHQVSPVHPSILHLVYDKLKDNYL